MSLPRILSLVICMLGAFSSLNSQITSFPHHQSFDSAVPPSLPEGWTSSHFKSPLTNDFTIAGSSPHSAPNAVIATNATLAQYLTSPACLFAGEVPSFVSFFLRRSASFTAPLVVEASTDGGSSFPFPVGDTLKPSGSTSYMQFLLAVPSQLANQSSVLFRWRILPESTGRSGTLRIDDITIEAQGAYDLSLNSMTFLPEIPIAQSPVTVILRVVNRGLTEVQSIAAELYEDSNNDSLAQPSELIGSVSHLGLLAPGDSAELTKTLGPFAPGEHSIIGKVVCSADQNPENDQLCSILQVGFPRACVILNEIMYAPITGEPEWVEVHNPGSDSINLRGWLMSDDAVSSKHPIAKGRIFIPPGEFLLLTKDSASLHEAHPTIRSLILEVTGFPSLNNSGDAVVLFDNAGRCIDSVRYSPSWGGSGGTSLERMDPAAESLPPSNWGSSRAKEGSTPGARNSIARKTFDLSIDTLIVSPATGTVENEFTVIVRVKNVGTGSAEMFEVLLFIDANDDSLNQESEIVARSSSSSQLLPMGSCDIPVRFHPLYSGRRLITGKAVYLPDGDSTNNCKSRFLDVGNPPGSLLINEVMYSPPPGIPEWVELFNPHPEPISLRNWRIGNRSSRYFFSSVPSTVPPYGFVLLTKDTALFRQAYGALASVVLQVSSLPTFLWANGGDAVVVQDAAGSVIDSLYYWPAWSIFPGTSMERVNAGVSSNTPANWRSSEDSARATPGRVNSVAFLDFDLTVTSITASSEWPAGPATVLVTVKNAGKNPGGSFSLVLYDDLNKDSVVGPGELVSRIANAQPISSGDSVVLSVHGVGITSGYHHLVAFVEFPADQRPNNNSRFSWVYFPSPDKSIVVNEIMFAPLQGNAEYVEFLNVSSGDMDLSLWSVSDQPRDGKENRFMLGERPQIVHTGELFLLASDSSILKRYPELGQDAARQSMILNLSSLGLNNDGDAIILHDPSGRTVDSVAFLPSWHNPSIKDCTGRSLERIHPSLRSNDARSWNTCTAPSGGTPLRRNSIYTAALPGRARLSFSPNPFSPDNDGHDEFVVVHYEMPLQTSIMSIRIFDVTGRLIRRLVNVEPGGPQGDVVWDGRDDYQQVARIGPYIVFCEAMNEQGGVILTAKGIVVLAKRLR